MVKRIVKKQLRSQEKSLEKYLAKKEVVISSNGDIPTQTVQFVSPSIYNEDDDDENNSLFSKIGNFFRAIFDNLLEIFLLVVFVGCVIYFIVNDDARTFIMNILNSFFK